MTRKFILSMLIIAYVVCLVSALFALLMCGAIAVNLSIVSGVVGIIFSVLFIVSKHKKVANPISKRSHLFWAIAIPLVCTLLLVPMLEIQASFYPFPWMYAEHTGAALYLDNTYRNYRYGKLATEYLPGASELSNARVVDYCYENGSMIETLIHRTDTFHILSVQYDEEQYVQEKISIRSQGIDWGNWDSQEEWLLEHKDMPIHDAYSVAVFFDQTQTILYMVIVTHNSNPNVDQFLYLNYYDAYAKLDIWKNAKGESDYN